MPERTFPLRWKNRSASHARLGWRPLTWGRVRDEAMTDRPRGRAGRYAVTEEHVPLAGLVLVSSECLS
jgi:hypothetical protein